MKLSKASKKLEILLRETNNKSERKVYQLLHGVVSSLGERELPLKEMQSIEGAIEGLHLEEVEGISLENLKRSRNQFMKFLKEEHRLIPQGHFTELGLIFGMIAGIALTPLIENSIGLSMGISLGITLGLIVGMIVGLLMDKDAEKQNRVLATR